jgi:hypothetical protein
MVHKISLIMKMLIFLLDPLKKFYLNNINYTSLKLFDKDLSFNKTLPFIVAKTSYLKF